MTPPTVDTAPHHLGSGARRAFVPTAQRYRALLRSGNTLDEIPDYLRLLDRVDIATVAARGVRLAARDARDCATRTVTLEIRRPGDEVIVAHRVSAELYAVAVVLGEYLRLPATDHLVADMAATLGRDLRYELCTPVELLMTAYQLLLTDPGSELKLAS